jgi:hypothetical protein
VKLAKDAKPQGVQEDGSSREIPDDVEPGGIRRWQHGAMYPPTNDFVKTKNPVG